MDKWMIKYQVQGQEFTAGPFECTYEEALYHYRDITSYVGVRGIAFWKEDGDEVKPGVSNG